MMILVDMDGVLVDFEKGFLDAFRRLYPNKPYIPLEKRTTMYIKDQYPMELHPCIEQICHAPGFFVSLEPVVGGLEALSDMSNLADVFICTSPLSKNKTCASEKIEWVEKYLDLNWAKKVIIADDKTLVRGDILIDDKPEIKGIMTPLWEHVVYDQPYNAHVTSKRRLNWQNWKSVLGM